jgi:hypothetical protein
MRRPLVRARSLDVPIRERALARRASCGLVVLCGLWASLVASGCRAPDDLDGPADTAGSSLRGQLVEYVADGTEGRVEARYALREGLDEERTLLFDAPPAFAPNEAIRVWGRQESAGFHVDGAEAAPSATASVASALTAAQPFAPRSFAFVLVDLGGGVNLTADDVRATLLTSAGSIRNYYRSDSYGAQDITAQVFGPLSYPATDCPTAKLASDLRSRIPGTFEHYLWYFGSGQTSCGWGGLATVGTPDAPSQDTWYNGSISCNTLVQEPGHNFGMQHSSALACPGTTFADDPNLCTSSEYGDPFDTMGSGCRHMNAWQKDYQGWFGACNGVTVQASGTFTLLPIEQPCDGVQFLKVVAPKARTFNRAAAGGGTATVETLSHYYLELRTPRDFDGLLGNETAMAPQVLLHVGGDVRDRTQVGLHTYLLDTTPATTGPVGFYDAALGVGKSFSDPGGGLTITVQAVSATQATIVVDLPGGTVGPTCLDETPFTMPGPGPETCTAVDAGSTSGDADAAGGDGGSVGPPVQTSGGGCQMDGPAPVGWIEAFALAALVWSSRARTRRRGARSTQNHARAD